MERSATQQWRGLTHGGMVTRDEILEQLGILEERLRKNIAAHCADRDAKLSILSKDCDELPPVDDIYISLAEAARVLGISRPTAKRWFQQHPIPHVKINRQTRIRLSALRRWREEIEQRTRTPNEKINSRPATICDPSVRP